MWFRKKQDQEALANAVVRALEHSIAAQARSLAVAELLIEKGILAEDEVHARMKPLAVEFRAELEEILTPASRR